MLVGGKTTPLKNMKVSWDDDIPKIWENKIHVPNHQPAWLVQISFELLSYCNKMPLILGNEHTVPLGIPWYTLWIINYGRRIIKYAAITCHNQFCCWHNSCTSRTAANGMA